MSVKNLKSKVRASLGLAGSAEQERGLRSPPKNYVRLRLVKH